MKWCLLSLMLMLLGWLLDIGGLYLAIVTAKAEELKLSKALVFVSTVGEYTTTIAWYLLLMSLGGMILF